jgi:hypothetical protein
MIIYVIARIRQLTETKSKMRPGVQSACLQIIMRLLHFARNDMMRSDSQVEVFTKITILDISILRRG